MKSRDLILKMSESIFDLKILNVRAFQTCEGICGNEKFIRG